jgi:hypothetical protein
MMVTMNGTTGVPVDFPPAFGTERFSVPAE